MNDRRFGHRVLAALAAFAAVTLVGCGSGAAAPTPSPEPSATPTPAPAATATPTPVPPTPTATAAPAVRLPQPPVRDVPLALFSGDTLRLSDLHGQIVVLNFWASWCGPCVTEMPAFERVYNDYRERGVTFLGIDTQDVELAARAFADRIDVTYPLAVDETGRLRRRVRDRSGPTASSPAHHGDHRRRRQSGENVGRGAAGGDASGVHRVPAGDELALPGGHSMRADGRKPDELRPVAISTGFQEFAEGSVLIETGRTRVLCAVSVEDGVPRFLRNTGQGWVTAEYSMLPRSTNTRTRRETTPRGRTQEIQRLVGRSLRAAVDMKALGERTLMADCDVLQADGGTRTAAITGAYVAVRLAVATLMSGATWASVLCGGPSRRRAWASWTVGAARSQLRRGPRGRRRLQRGHDRRGGVRRASGHRRVRLLSKSALDEIVALGALGTSRLFEAQREVLSGV